MKLLLLAIIILSCSKDSQKTDADTQCWHCELGNSPNGDPNPARDTCVPAWEPAPHFTDSRNNSLNSQCTKQ